jgi:hypothetical protein
MQLVLWVMQAILYLTHCLVVMLQEIQTNLYQTISLSRLVSGIDKQKKILIIDLL